MTARSAARTAPPAEVSRENVVFLEQLSFSVALPCGRHYFSPHKTAAKNHRLSLHCRFKRANARKIVRLTPHLLSKHPPLRKCASENHRARPALPTTSACLSLHRLYACVSQHSSLFNRAKEILYYLVNLDFNRPPNDHFTCTVGWSLKASFILAGCHVRASAGDLAVHGALIPRVCLCVCLSVCPVSNSFLITPQIWTKLVSVDR